MSRRARRPEPLARLVARSDRRCILAAGWFVLVALLNLAGGRAEDRVFDGATIERATVDAGYRPGSGDLTVPVHVGERAVETREVRDAPLPAPGAVVLVEVAPDQPAVVRLTGESYSPIADLAIQVGPLVVCLVLAVGRRRFAAAAVRRAAGDEPTFGLLGVVRPAPFSRQRCLLDLYGLDAAMEAPPVVSVPLAGTGEVPLDVPVTVGCKGVPRPYSLVVGRVGDVVLWPSAPAIGSQRRPGRPAGLVEPEPLPVTEARRVSLPRLWRRPGILVAGAGLLLLAGTAVVVVLGAGREADRVATWDRAEATVVGPGEESCTVEVAYRAGSREQQVTVTTGDCASVASGPGHLVLVDPADPSHALLLSSRYDPWTPLAWAAFVAFVGGGWGATAYDRHRHERELAGGPWRWVVRRGPDGAGAVAGPADPPGVVRCYLQDGDPPSVPRAVAVAGEVAPGGTFLTDELRDGRAVEHRGRARSARSSWLDR